MSTPKIRDIPSISKLLQDLRNMDVTAAVLPSLRPVLQTLGVDPAAIEGPLKGSSALLAKAEDLARLPDVFNDHFCERGWIMHGDMDVGVAKEAVQLADAGNLEAAELALVEYYGPKNVETMLLRMGAVQAFRPRMALAEKALLDYAEGRYHACVPVVIALLDGMVCDVHDTHRGFFAEGTDLSAWDSIAAHDRGLNALSVIFKKGRKKTCVDQISIPYRHGIMHGMDLGYDNRLVAAKAWAALVATREWAIKAERGDTEPQEEDPEPSWAEIVNKLRENAEDKKRLGSWRSRDLTPGKDFPADGSPEEYPSGSPERVLVEYLTFWKQKNYGFMARCLSPMLRYEPSRAPAIVRSMFEDKSLTAFELQAIKEPAAAVTEIQVLLNWTGDDGPVTHVHTFRLINGDASGMAQPSGKPGSRWWVMGWGV
jgi:hypothetical protein